MKPTKVRNYQIYRATYATRSKQLGSPLSKDLRQKYGKRSMRVILGDSVKVLRGEYRGIDGKVSKILTQVRSLAIEGIKKEKGKGEKFDILIQASNVVITGLNLDDHWRKTKLQGKKPKSTPKETKTEEVKEEKPKEQPTKIKKPKKETRTTKKSEKTKKTEPKKTTKLKSQKKKKEVEG